MNDIEQWQVVKPDGGIEFSSSDYKQAVSVLTSSAGVMNHCQLIRKLVPRPEPKKPLECWVWKPDDNIEFPYPWDVKQVAPQAMKDHIGKWHHMREVMPVDEKKDDEAFERWYAKNSCWKDLWLASHHYARGLD